MLKMCISLNYFAFWFFLVILHAVFHPMHVWAFIDRKSHNPKVQSTSRAPHKKWNKKNIQLVPDVFEGHDEQVRFASLL